MKSAQQSNQDVLLAKPNCIASSVSLETRLAHHEAWQEVAVGCRIAKLCLLDASHGYFSLNHGFRTPEQRDR
jgi:hypothetical protein